MVLNKVVVYLGSAAGNSPVYADNAAELGRRLAQAGVEIIYGGASVGTMWTMASAAIEAGGKVTGVFPKNFKGKKESRDRRIEVRAQGLAEMVETPDLASRVAKMTELSQALFCWLLGRQLCEHSKPVFILNTDGYYDSLRELFAIMASRGFMSDADAAIPCFCSTVGEVVEKVLNWK